MVVDDGSRIVQLTWRHGSPDLVLLHLLRYGVLGRPFEVQPAVPHAEDDGVLVIRKASDELFVPLHYVVGVLLLCLVRALHLLRFLRYLLIDLLPVVERRPSEGGEVLLLHSHEQLLLLRSFLAECVHGRVDLLLPEADEFLNRLL